MDSAFDLRLKDTGSNPAKAGCGLVVYTYRAEGRFNQLTPGIAGTSVATLGKSAQVYSAFHPYLVNKLSTGCKNGLGKGGRCCLCRVSGTSV